jgi:alpha-1,6-mannosyltransferase
MHDPVQLAEIVGARPVRMPAFREGRLAGLLLGGIGLAMLAICLFSRWDRSVSDLLIGEAALFALYGGAVWVVRANALRQRWLVAAIVIIGVAMRLAIVSDRPPIADDDIWRYRWDGLVVAHGINPYRYAPIDDPLDTLDDGTRAQVSFPWIKTIYPPLAEALFGITYALHPQGIWPFKVLAIGFDLATCLPIAIVLSRQRRQMSWLLLYLWHPMILKECADSGHLDAVMTCFLITALAFGASRAVPSVISLVASIGAKLIPIVLLPLLVRGWTARIVCGLGLLGLAACVGWRLPDGSDGLGGWAIFARHWEFNSGPFAVVQGLTLWMAGPAWLPRVFCGGAALAWMIHVVRRPTEPGRDVLRVLVGVLVMAPVVNPWYLTVLVPLSILWWSPVTLIWTGIVNISYGHYLGWGDIWYRLIEYGGLGICVIWASLARRHPPD